MERVVFHPDYSYSDFVGQILPKVEDGVLRYLYSPGPFTKILKKAWQDPQNYYYLVVEELNRGNAPAIFGEIFQLLDRKADTEAYARLDSGFKQFLDFVQNDPTAARMLVASENQELLKQLLRLITQSESRESLQQSLESLENSSLDCLSDTLNIEKLKRVAQLMESNMDNCSEEFWQSTVFKENQWVLAQIFSTPCTIYEDKAYVGGKSMSNRDGNVCDFIYQNELSQNIALIEIKTPCTPIIGNSYRATYSFSSEMSGAINQVLNYKDSLTKEFYSLQSKSSPRFEVFNPKCVVIIGRISAMEVDEVAAFERFRNSLNNVTVVTFDELYTRITGLITMLSNKQSE